MKVINILAGMRSEDLQANKQNREDLINYAHKTWCVQVDICIKRSTEGLNEKTIEVLEI